MEQKKQLLMREAIRLSRTGIRRGGGPFGAVVVKNGKVIGRGWNKVTTANDPTAHAEIVAIRAACRALKTFDLSGCELYASCMPCPMCLSAAYWARIETVFYACGTDDAARAGFDDRTIYKEVRLAEKKRSLRATQLLRTEALIVLDEWKQLDNKRSY